MMQDLTPEEIAAADQNDRELRDSLEPKHRENLSFAEGAILLAVGSASAGEARMIVRHLLQRAVNIDSVRLYP